MLAARFLIGAVGFTLALSAPSDLTDSRTQREAVGSQAKRAAETVPLRVISCGSNSQCYRVDVAIGTPPKNFRLTLDSSAMYESIHVFSSKMAPPNSTCKSTDIRRQRYDPSLSSTYVIDGEGQGMGGGEPYYPYEDPKCTHSVFGFGAYGFDDTMKIGSASVPLVPANLITVIQAPLNPEWDADGFFSIHTPFGADWKADDTISVVLSSFERPLMTLYLAKVDYFEPGSEQGGALTLGGADTEHCDGRYTEMHTPPGTFLWSLMVESVSIKGKSFRVWQFTQIDVTSSFITAPQTAVDAIAKATDAEYDFQSDTYQVDCARRATFPDLVFKMPLMEYHVAGTDYARRLTASAKRCTLLLVPGNVQGDSTYWSLGTTFLRSHCALIDFKKQTLSLAKVLR